MLVCYKAKESARAPSQNSGGKRCEGTMLNNRISYPDRSYSPTIRISAFR